MALNLLSNAIKFTQSGYVFLRVFLGQHGEMCIEVEDTGPGIAAEKLPLLFQRFSQTDSSTTRKFGGTGLGLAIVRELAELMGGRVTVESKLGAGSKFGIILPISVAAPLPAPATSAEIACPKWQGPDSFQVIAERLTAELVSNPILHFNRDQVVAIDSSDFPRPLKSRWLINRLRGVEESRTEAICASASHTPRRFDGHRVLLVEDNAVNQKVGVRMLEKLGCRVDVAANGFEAVEMVSQLPYDLVLMDCQMPEMDGFQAARQIRTLGAAAKRVNIVALTAAASPQDRQQCLLAGMNDYLTKPVSLDALAKALEAWTGKTPPVPAPLG
jgi:CheY-like chemotaxis protein